MSVTRSARAIATPGYEGKTLWQRLGLKSGLRVWLQHAPDDYWALCGFDPASVAIAAPCARQFDFGHLFASNRTSLARDLPAAARKLDASGMLWIS